MQGLIGAKDLFGASDEDSGKHQRLLEWLGIIPTPSNQEFLSICPFRDCPSFLENKEEKFTMNRKTTQWRCFVCGRTGNKYDLMRLIHEQAKSLTTPEDIETLRLRRKGAIDVEELMESGIALNPDTKEWMYPVFSLDGKMMNLYLYRKQYSSTGREFYQFMSLPAMHHVPIGLQHFRTGTQRKIWICEGQWDYMAWRGLLRRVGQLSEYDVLGVPGSGTFPKRFLAILNGRSVLTLYDNDQAGEAGTQALLDSCIRNGILLANFAKMNWPPELPSGYDISNAITSLPENLWKKKSK